MEKEYAAALDKFMPQNKKDIREHLMKMFLYDSEFWTTFIDGWHLHTEKQEKLKNKSLTNESDQN